MALLDDLGKGFTPGNVAIGLGAALLAPVLAPAVSSVLRPAARAVMRTGITVYRGTVQPVGAALGNLVAEAQMELATAQSGRRDAESSGEAQQDGARQDGPRRDEARQDEAAHHSRSHKRRAGESDS